MLIEADLIIRQDTAANWATNNPILQNGQEGFETDTRKSKVGKGLNWNDTLYRFTGSGGARQIILPDTTNYPQTTYTENEDGSLTVNVGADLSAVIGKFKPAVRFITDSGIEYVAAGRYFTSDADGLTTSIKLDSIDVSQGWQLYFEA